MASNIQNNEHSDDCENQINNDSEQLNDIPDDIESCKIITRCEFSSASGQFYSFALGLESITIYRSDVYKNALVICLNNSKFYATKNNKKHTECASIFISKETFLDIVKCFNLSYDASFLNIE